MFLPCSVGALSCNNIVRYTYRTKTQFIQCRLPSYTHQGKAKVKFLHRLQFKTHKLTQICHCGVCIAMLNVSTIVPAPLPNFPTGNPIAFILASQTLKWCI